MGWWNRAKWVSWVRILSCPFINKLESHAPYSLYAFPTDRQCLEPVVYDIHMCILSRKNSKIISQTSFGDQITLCPPLYVKIVCAPYFIPPPQLIITDWPLYVHNNLIMWIISLWYNTSFASYLCTVNVTPSLWILTKKKMLDVRILHIPKSTCPFLLQN